MAQSPIDLADLEDEISLNEGFFKSLADEADAQPERDRINERLKHLRSRLSKMYSQQQSLPYWGSSSSQQPNVAGQNDDLWPSSSIHSTSSDHTSTTANRSTNYPSNAMKFPSRKRERSADDFQDLSVIPAAKSHRSTPQPHSSSRATSVDSFDFFDEFRLQDVLGDDWQEKERENKDYLKTLEARKRQEQEDAEFARSLQQKWNNEHNSPQPVPKTSAPQLAASSSSMSQSYMRPNGSWQKPTPQPVPQPTHPRLKIEHKSESASPGTMTPLTDSSSGLEEISANDWDNRLGSANRSLNIIRSSAAYPQTSNMPGAFPIPRYNLPYNVGGSSVYGNSYSPYGSSSTQVGSTLYGRGFGSNMPGSSNLPFDLDSMPSPSYDSGCGDRADPAQTQEEIKELLKHIRPDEELTEEQQREVQPDAMEIDLMPHQRKGYAWLKSMEEGTNKGGILADDMGLGKTVQALALILGRPPEPGSDRPTLVVAPVALMQQWEREIKRFVKKEKRLSVLILHGENRNKPWEFVKRFDVVLTTYGTLSSDLKRKLVWDSHGNPDAKRKPQQEFPLLGEQSTFHRIILDEAQNIKNKGTKAAVAACKVKATYRWCLSGTPMQNNVDEIYSLIKFCRIRPYHDYEKFARDIGRPLKRSSDYGKEKAMKQLQAILKAILLRRTKESKIDGQPILQLPEKRTIEDLAIFSKDELDFYKQLESQAQIQFNKYLKNGTVGRHYSHALVLLLRLRQCCCSPQLVTSAKDFLTSGSLDGVDHLENARNLSKDVVRRLDDNDAFECPICMDAVDNPIIFVPCGHTLCNECLGAMVDKAMTDAQMKILCPHCRAEVDTKKVTDLDSYLRVYHPDRPGVEPINEEDADDSDSDSDSDESDADLQNDDNDDGADLKDFIVPDDEVESSGDEETDLKAILQRVKSEVIEDKKPVVHKKIEMKPAEKAKKAKKAKKDKTNTKSKGKEKAKNKQISLADLRKDGLRSKAAKKRYLRRLEKGFHTSAKIEKTLELLHEIRDRGEGEKTIVFSSFTSFLDLIEVPLHKDDELSNYARYDGSMKATDRNDAVIRFSDDPLCKVMLVSLKAGNSGLNLTAANHVIILDPFWNPFVEYQAADRCYRIGQQREVTIHRVLIGESDNMSSKTVADDQRDFTVEDRILRLQEKKRKLVEMALDENAASSLGRLTTQDLGFLFGVNSMS